MSTKENVLFSIRDDITPKWVVGGAVTGTLNARDNNGPQCVVTYKKTSHAKSSEDGQGWTETEINDTSNVFDSGETRTPTIVLENHPADSRVKISRDGIVQTLSSRMGTGGNNVPMVMEGINGDTAGTLDSNYFKGCGERQGTEKEIVCTDTQYDNLVVRRLTPLECSRLQGYPDGWLDIGEWVDSKGKLHKDADAPKYKAAGNSIALPFWQWLMNRIAEQLRKDGVENPTMASLFDGISGFPLCAARAGIQPIWSSEIEEYPIAVAEKHFGENGDYKNYI